MGTKWLDWFEIWCTRLIKTCTNCSSLELLEVGLTCRASLKLLKKSQKETSAIRTLNWHSNFCPKTRQAKYLSKHLRKCLEVKYQQMQNLKPKLLEACVSGCTTTICRQRWHSILYAGLLDDSLSKLCPVQPSIRLASHVKWGWALRK